LPCTVPHTIYPYTTTHPSRTFHITAPPTKPPRACTVMPTCPHTTTLCFRCHTLWFATSATFLYVPRLELFAHSLRLPPAGTRCSARAALLPLLLHRTCLHLAFLLYTSLYCWFGHHERRVCAERGCLPSPILIYIPPPNTLPHTGSRYCCATRGHAGVRQLLVSSILLARLIVLGGERDKVLHREQNTSP